MVSLAMVLTLGPVERFPNSRKLVSYPGTESALSTPVADKPQAGWERFREQGNEMMRWLLVEGQPADGGAATIRSCAAPICDSSCTAGEWSGESGRRPPPGGQVGILDCCARR